MPPGILTHTPSKCFSPLPDKDITVTPCCAFSLQDTDHHRPNLSPLSHPATSSEGDIDSQPAMHLLQASVITRPVYPTLCDDLFTLHNVPQYVGYPIRYIFQLLPANASPRCLIRILLSRPAVPFLYRTLTTTGPIYRPSHIRPHPRKVTSTPNLPCTSYRQVLLPDLYIPPFVTLCSHSIMFAIT